MTFRRISTALISRWRSWRRLATDTTVWYHPEYELDVFADSARARGIVADRARLVVGRLRAEGLLSASRLRRPRAASYRDLARFHPGSFLEEVADPELLARVYGLPAGRVDVGEVLQAARRAVGGTVAAAAVVARGRGRVAVNLGGGFHHAEPEQAGGFCVLNDVAVAIRRLRSQGYTAPVAVVDLDYHQGNGNVVGFADDASVLTYSIHGAIWTRVEAVADVGIVLPTGTEDDAYLAVLRQTLPQALQAHGPRLVFYIAGNDVLRGDALGDFRLTRRGVLERDRFVAGCAQGLSAGLVVSLGGGYSDAAWECTANLLRWLLAGVAEVREPAKRDLRAEYRRIADAIDPAELQRPDAGTWELTEEDVLGQLLGPRKAQRVLGFYTRHGVEFAFGRYGVLDRLRERGFADLEVSVDPSDPDRQTVRIHGRRGGAGPRLLLVELVVRSRTLAAPAGWDAGESLRVLWIEWLLLQDPTASFSLARPPLPGQEHPGLGVAEEVQELLLQACRRLGLDGLASAPAHFHNAVGAAGDWAFLDPRVQGRFDALRGALSGLGLHDASALVDAGRLRLSDGEAVCWLPVETVLPLSERLTEWLGSEAYARLRREAEEELAGAGLGVVPGEA